MTALDAKLRAIIAGPNPALTASQRATIEEAADALSSIPEQGVGVKALEWQLPEGPPGSDTKADAGRLWRAKVKARKEKEGSK